MQHSEHNAELSFLINAEVPLRSHNTTFSLLIFYVGNSPIHLMRDDGCAVWEDPCSPSRAGATASNATGNLFTAHTFSVRGGPSQIGLLAQDARAMSQELAQVISS